MVGWHHRLNGHEFKQTLKVKDEEAWRVAVHGISESDMTEQQERDFAPIKYNKYQERFIFDSTKFLVSV